MPETDAELVGLVRRGSRDGAGRLIKRYLRGSRAVALAILGDETGADDVCQDAFVYAIERIDELRHPQRFGAWLMQIVRNRARNARRDLRRDVVPLESVTLASAIPSPERQLEQRDLRDDLLDALAQLSEVRREVVLLHDLEGWTHREIAERLALPVGTVRSHLHHARRRLRERLAEREESGS
jgi:RNA polymerase sigma-70 factor (ECF subfamily)